MVLHFGTHFTSKFEILTPKKKWKLQNHRSYPSIDAKVEPVIIKRSLLEGETVLPFSFSKFGKDWIYIISSEVEHEEEPETNEEGQDIPKSLIGREYPGPLGRVKAFSICFLTKVTTFLN